MAWAEVNAWRCAICKVEGEAPDKRSAEIALGKHWQTYHYSRRTNADRDPDD
jgi:hypothetical protein